MSVTYTERMASHGNPGPIRPQSLPDPQLQQASQPLATPHPKAARPQSAAWQPLVPDRRVERRGWVRACSMVSLVIRGSLTSTSPPSLEGARLRGEFWIALTTDDTSCAHIQSQRDGPGANSTGHSQVRASASAPPRHHISSEPSRAAAPDHPAPRDRARLQMLGSRRPRPPASP